MYIKLAAVLLIFFGESFSIIAELVASKRIAASDGAGYLNILFWPSVLIVLGGAMLIVGYMLGYLHFKNIWIIAAVSIGSLLVAEPVLAFALFRETPTTGAVIGLTLGALGTLAALFI